MGRYSPEAQFSSIAQTLSGKVSLFHQLEEQEKQREFQMAMQQSEQDYWTKKEAKQRKQELADAEKEATDSALALQELFGPQDEATGTMSPLDYEGAPNVSPQPDWAGGEQAYGEDMAPTGGVQMSPETQAQYDAAISQENVFVRQQMLEYLEPTIRAEQAEFRAMKLIEPLQFLADTFRTETGFEGPLTLEQMNLASQMRPDLFDPDYAFAQLQSRTANRMWEKQTAWSFSQQGSSDEDIATFFGESYTAQDIRQFVDGWQMEVDRIKAEQAATRGGRGGGGDTADEDGIRIREWYSALSMEHRALFDEAEGTAPVWMTAEERIEYAIDIVRKRQDAEGQVGRAADMPQYYPPEQEQEQPYPNLTYENPIIGFAKDIIGGISDNWYGSEEGWHNVVSDARSIYADILSGNIEVPEGADSPIEYAARQASKNAGYGDSLTFDIVRRMNG